MKHYHRHCWPTMVLALFALIVLIVSPSCTLSRFGLPPGPLVLPGELTLSLECLEDRGLVLDLSNTASRTLELMHVDVLSADPGFRQGLSGIPLSFRLSCALSLGPGEGYCLEYPSGEPGSPPSEYFSQASELRIYRVNGHPWPSLPPALE